MRPGFAGEAALWESALSHDVCLCAIFDKADENSLQTVLLESQSVKEVTSQINKANILLKEQNVKIEEINNSMTGILGLAKGTLELAPTMKPSVNIQPEKTRSPRKPQKDTIEIETKVKSQDSIVITINSGDSIMSTPTLGGNSNSPAASKCCCCHCCCKGCRKEGCR
jgi:PBP1b-binding outer membrane lipoprotein LpoB